MKYFPLIALYTLHFVIPGRKKMVLFYSDVAANLSKSLQEDKTVLKGTSNAVLIGASIKNDGTIERKVVAGGSSSKSVLALYNSVND